MRVHREPYCRILVRKYYHIGEEVALDLHLAGAPCEQLPNGVQAEIGLGVETERLISNCSDKPPI